jgi:hypothetical protein
VKRYASAKARFFKPAIINFFARECPKFFGPLMREKMADELINLFEAIAPETTRIKPGQILWNALDKNTRGDSPRRRYVPVVLTLISEQDVEQLTHGVSITTITQEAVARMIRQAYAQGAVLSMRDISLLILRSDSMVSKITKRYEKQHECTLPHTGALHDMGSCVSHKTTIVQKIVLKKKDPADVARECNHSQRSVDHYMKDYHRVKTLYDLNQDVEFIHLATQIAKHVVVQYIMLIKEEGKTS